MTGGGHKSNFLGWEGPEAAGMWATDYIRVFEFSCNPRHVQARHQLLVEVRIMPRWPQARGLP